MEKIFLASDSSELYNFITEANKYNNFFDDIDFVKATSTSNIVERNTCVIIDKADYELDILRLFAKKMYVILCTENKELDIDIENDNKIVIVDKPYNIEQIYCAIKTMLEYKNMDRELSKNRDIEVDVRHAAETDYLTGLPNRRGMYEYFDIQVKTETVHCMFIDIDNFKKVNDTYGHKMGDKLLIKVSQLIKTKVREAFFARLSGDEFAIIMNGNMSKDQVISIAESIISAKDEINMSVDVNSMISFSIGIMFDQHTSDDLDDILMRCDAAMYKAKKSGKGRYVIYNDIEEQVTYKMSVDRDKYNAIAGKQFKIYIQPIMDFATSGMDRAEAKIFWEHPRDGLRAPEEFMDILEEDGFIVDLELKMFDELCKIMSGWEKEILESVQVIMRMSKKHLYNKKYLQRLLDTMSIYELKPENFCLGFDEFESHPRIPVAIGELKKVGFGVACAKGIGDSKLALLNINDSMADVWVIQKSLVEGICVNKTQSVLARSIISLAKELNIEVLSAGVSDQKEMDALSSYGCDLGSGPIFREPMRPEAFDSFAKKNIQVKKNSYIYDFHGNLADQNGINEGRFIGSGCKFEHADDIDKDAIRFVGTGEVVLDNTVELPAGILDAKNYSISICVKVEEFELWAAIFYAQFKNGFASIMPYAWDGVVMYRVKDVVFEEDWHDAIGNELETNQWYYITVTYNGKKQESRLYVNGKLTASRGDVHTVDDTQKIVIGGDIYKGAFKGMISRVVIRDYVISSDDADKEYQEYFAEK